MRSFERLNRWLVICCVGCITLLTNQSFSQSTKFKDETNERVEQELKEAKLRLSDLERQLEADSEDLSLIQMEMDKVLGELARREQMFAESGIAPQAYAEVLGLLQTMRVQLKIDLAGLQARQEYLRNMKPATSATQLGQVEFLNKKLVIAQKIRDLSVGMAEKAEKSRQSGVISLDELSKIKVESENAAMKLVELEAELEERKAAIVENNQPALLAIQQTGLEIAEKEARLKQVEAQLSTTAEVGPEAMQAEIKKRMLLYLDKERERVLNGLSERELEKRWALAVVKQCEEELERRKK